MGAPRWARPRPVPRRARGARAAAAPIGAREPRARRRRDGAGAGALRGGLPARSRAAPGRELRRRPLRSGTRDERAGERPDALWPGGPAPGRAQPRRLPRRRAPGREAAGRDADRLLRRLVRAGGAGTARDHLLPPGRTRAGRSGRDLRLRHLGLGRTPLAARLPGPRTPLRPRRRRLRVRRERSGRRGLRDRVAQRVGGLGDAVRGAGRRGRRVPGPLGDRAGARALVARGGQVPAATLIGV